MSIKYPRLETLPKERVEGWPKVCQASWLDTFVRWESEGGGKQLTPDLVSVIRHTLEANLRYIEELEK